MVKNVINGETEIAPSLIKIEEEEEIQVLEEEGTETLINLTSMEDLITRIKVLTTPTMDLMKEATAIPKQDTIIRTMVLIMEVDTEIPIQKVAMETQTPKVEAIKEIDNQEVDTKEVDIKEGDNKEAVIKEDLNQRWINSNPNSA